MKYVLVLAVGIALAVTGVFCATAQQKSPAPPLEAFQPDDPQPWQPDRPQPRVLTGYDTIILGSERGNARIILTVDGKHPRVVLESNKTGERGIMYLTSQGQAIVGVTTKARSEVGSGIYVDRGLGKLMMCAGDGCFTFDGPELQRRTGGIGKLPTE